MQERRICSTISDVVLPSSRQSKTPQTRGPIIVRRMLRLDETIQVGRCETAGGERRLRQPACPTQVVPPRKRARQFAQVLACGAALLTCACIAGLRSGLPAPSIGEVETAYAGLREAKDAIDALEARLPGAGGSRSLAEWRRLYSERRGMLTARLGALRAVSLASDDRRAADVMRHALEGDLAPLETAARTNAAQAPPSCESVHSGELSLAMLKRTLFACFAEAAGRIRFEGRTLDRLSALGELARIPEPWRRKALFVAMEPIWRAVNGEGDAASPYRRLVALTAAERATGNSAVDGAARGLGIDAAATESWLAAILDAWREATPTDPVEPWDFRYLGGEPGRLLLPSIPLERMREINDRYYRDLGADPSALRVRYELAPRSGKDPVAYTSFLFRGFASGGVWNPAAARVSATYREGGFDNLGELLHETGHAIHIAAIRTRPAFEDWPDSDVFTEAWADVPALELYEPVWQRKYLGIGAPPSASILAKYNAVILDVAWGLFEIRMLREPAADPDAVWTDITSTYLHVVPHPEWSWWAVRGQLVDAPGYMLNYALGAAVTADLRTHIIQIRGPFARGDAGWYEWVSEQLLRFGLERPTREVLASFLGRAPSPDALIQDLRRMHESHSSPGVGTRPGKSD
jgi:hypothetical protein